MSVLSCDECADSPQGGGDLNKRTWTRKFRVVTSDINDGPAIVGAASGLPLMYSPYTFGNEHDDYALLRNIDSSRVQPASKIWITTCRYETPDVKDARGNASGGTSREKLEAFDNPLLQYPEIETALESKEEAVYFIYDSTTQQITPCRASNSQVFDPPPMRQVSILNLTITRNESITSVLHPAVDITYQDAVNDDVFWGCPPGQWLCAGITTKRQTKQLPNGVQFPYLACSYKFKGKVTWDTRLLDHGSFYLLPDSEQPLTGPKLTKNFKTTVDNHPTTGLLDGFGRALDPAANPVFLTFRFHKRLPFGGLALPQSFQQVA